MPDTGKLARRHTAGCCHQQLTIGHLQWAEIHVTNQLDRQMNHDLVFTFLPRDSLHKRGLCSGKMSVCQFVTGRYCVETAIQILKLFTIWWLSHSSFPYQTLWQYSDGGSNAEATKNRGFRPIARFISKMIQDRASYYGTPIETHMRPIEWCHFPWLCVTSCDLAKYSMTRNIARLLCDSWGS